LLKVGVVGCGYWGPNLIRNFTQLNSSEVVICSDLNDDRLGHMKSLYPHLELTKDFQEILSRNDIEAVVVATPPQTHHAIGMEVLKAGKHLFVEKPLAISGAQCEDLVREAAQRKLKLITGHTFVYTAAVNKIKDLISSGELGEIMYISSTRVNLGIFQEEINVVWDLAPHDVSIMNYILDSTPESVCANGQSYIRDGIEDVAFVTLKYPNNIMANIHVSWLNPDKIRATTVVGSKKMLVYDDISSLEKIRIYDKGVTVQPHYDTFAEFHLSYRFGDISIPKLDEIEPLKVESQHFIDCIREDRTPRSSGVDGLNVVRVIEAANNSLKNSGSMVSLNPAAV